MATTNNPFWSHSENEQGERHDLVDHLRSTAASAEMFASELGIKDFAYILGLYHDLGKFHPAFQVYLDNPDAPRTVRDHSSAGAVHSCNSFPLGTLAAFGIAGHHSGLSDRAALQNRIREKKEDEDVKEAIRIGLQTLENHGVVVDNFQDHCLNGGNILN